MSYAAVLSHVYVILVSVHPSSPFPRSFNDDSVIAAIIIMQSADIIQSLQQSAGIIHHWILHEDYDFEFYFIQMFNKSFCAFVLFVLQSQVS